ncbi:MAG: PIN domain-containing protein [Treponema sp.]|jgi:PIN domain nuclease of toxin-antitoxin system|nr:PIN domain-containing protein [Treponema sp.]
MIYVLDACAIIAMLDTEPGSKKVRDLFIESLTSDVMICMSPVNLTEVYYDRIEVDGQDKAKEIYGWIKSSITVPENITDDIVQEAGRLKSQYKISLGDCFGLATAAVLSGTFVTADHHELAEVERNEAIPFLWIR